MTTARKAAESFASNFNVKTSFSCLMLALERVVNGFKVSGSRDLAIIAVCFFDGSFKRMRA